jgi:hypothetical protein
MTAAADGTLIDEASLVSQEAYEKNGPEGFPVKRLYKLNLYSEPQVIVTDRFGKQAQLAYDAEKQHLYTLIKLCYGAADVRVYADGRELSDCVNQIYQTGIKAGGTFDFLYELQDRFKEYEGLSEELPIPTYTSYYIDFTYDNISAQDRFGKPYELIVTEITYLGADFTSDDSMYDECSDLAIKMADALAMYLTRDLSFSAVKQYLLKDSEYAKLLSLYDHCLQGHTYPTLAGEKILGIKVYS